LRIDYGLFLYKYKQVGVWVCGWVSGWVGVCVGRKWMCVCNWVGK
jgi:hypothetical protein